MLDETLDRALVRALQGGLPRVARPYHAVAEQLGVPADAVMARIEAMLAAGAIRRIGVVPNHYRLGWTANGMSVWDVDDGEVDALGASVGALACVSHCYRRPRRLPWWPYNLFAMVHGRSRDEVHARVAEIAAVLAPHARAHDVLFSTRILKKAGLRFGSSVPSPQPSPASGGGSTSARARRALSSPRPAKRGEGPGVRGV
jgi:DNA-binding Lrp family transcriptional regulator